MNRVIPFLIQLSVSYFSQTLTTLDLSENEIDDQGAEHLANALAKNKVTRLVVLYFQLDR